MGLPEVPFDTSGANLAAEALKFLQTQASRPIEGSGGPPMVWNLQDSTLSGSNDAQTVRNITVL